MNKKKLAPILLFSLFLSQSPSRGIVGGPFDNDQIPGSAADGTYSCVLSGRNLIGNATFGVGSYEGFEGNGRFVVFHEGSVHYGAVSGMVDISSKRVSAGLLGVAGLPGETTGASAIPGTAGQVLTIRSSAEGAFSAFISGYPQKVLFEGEGALSSVANTAVTTTGTVTNTTTTIIVPAAPHTGQQGPQTTTVTTTETTSPAVTRTETPFKVRGSRTSRSPYTAFNSFSALPPLVPLVPSATATATAAP